MGSGLILISSDKSGRLDRGILTLKIRGVLVVLFGDFPSNSAMGVGLAM